MPSSGRDMLDRAALVHRWDCPAVAEPALPEPDVADIDAAAAAALRRPYDALAPADRAGGGAARSGASKPTARDRRSSRRRRCARAVAGSDRHACGPERATRLRAPGGTSHSRRAPCRRLPRRAGSVGDEGKGRRVARSRSRRRGLSACSALLDRQARHDDGRLPPVLLQLRAHDGARLMNNEGGNAWPTIRFGFWNIRTSPSTTRAAFSTARTIRDTSSSPIATR